MRRIQFVFVFMLMFIIYHDYVQANDKKSIFIIDSMINEYIQTSSSTSQKIPDMVRYCVDGYEFVVVVNGPAVSCIQVLDEKNNPKKCKGE